MNNDNDEKLNTENSALPLRRSRGASYSNPNSPVLPSDSLADTNADNPSPIQYESRRARRMSETAMMRQVPAPIKTETVKANPPAAITPQPVIAEPAKPSKRTAKAKHSEPKDYWGGTAMLTSAVVFLTTQVIATIIVIAYILFGNMEVLAELQVNADTETIESLIANSPWLLIFTQLISYAAWIGCMWWVTRYRSGVQTGIKFWTAFKKNFWLTTFKPVDIAYGVGIAAVMVGLQFAVLNWLPKVFPSMDVESAGNTSIFTNLDGIWFYVIAFGIGGLLGPICEELFFRGFLLRGFSNHFSYKNTGRNMDVLEEGLGEKALELRSMVISYRGFTHKYRYILSGIITSIIFGLMHFQGNWITVAFTGLLGGVMAAATLKLNRLYPALIAHVLYNTTLFLILTIEM